MRKFRIASVASTLFLANFILWGAPLGAQTSVYPVQRVDSSLQSFSDAVTQANAADGQNMQFQAPPPASGSDPTSVTGGSSAGANAGNAIASASITLKADQNCAPQQQVSVPRAEAVFSGGFSANVGTTGGNFARGELYFGDTIAQATYKILPNANGCSPGPVCYSTVWFLVSGFPATATGTGAFGGLFPLQLSATVDNTSLTATDGGSGFMIMGTVGNGAGQTQYQSGPWGDDINIKILGKNSNHTCGDTFGAGAEIHAYASAQNPAFGQAGAPGGTSQATLGFGAYSWCTIDDQ